MATRISCLNNIRQLTLASTLYADDDRFGSFSGRTSPGDQDLNWLLPYAGTTNLFSCPVTLNFIRPEVDFNRWTGHLGLKDLQNLASGRRRMPGSSYIGFGFFGEKAKSRSEIPFNGSWLTISYHRRTLHNVVSYRRRSRALGMQGHTISPSEHWIMLDSNSSGLLAMLDPTDNHGIAGSNVGFCDGHSEWIRRSEYLYRKELSQDENFVGIDSEALTR